MALDVSCSASNIPRPTSIYLAYNHDGCNTSG